jgi:hypothetical protein
MIANFPNIDLDFLSATLKKRTNGSYDWWKKCVMSAHLTIMNENVAFKS